MKRASAYWKLDVSVLLRIPHPTVNNHTESAEFLRSRGHEPSPTSRSEALGLLDVHDVAFLVGVREVYWRGWAGTVGLHHFHGEGRTIDADTWLWREHLHPIQKAPVRILELD